MFKGLTGEELAMRTGLSRRRLEHVESGAGLRVTADDLVAIARALELPLWFFFEVPHGHESPPVCPACGQE